ncbi:MAG: response regulator transcription factor [Proteobacteria bacterium]|nr:response regulator transcription factor [Pseudomonadota bacterium]MBU1739662.1 response regulator transcription factor [Pseudomonadota bacterium]
MKKIRVLLVDDHRLVREGLSSLLASYETIEVVGEAANGRQAIKMAENLRPDVIVMDIAMEEMNGIEATRKIGELCPDCKVVMLSMHATAEYIHNSFNAGASGYLLKESAGQEVLEAITIVHRGRKFLSHRLSETLAGEMLLDGKKAHAEGPIQSLSPREREIVQLVVEGKSSSEIADILFLSVKTIESYRSRLMKKLGTPNIPSLVKFAIKHGLTPLE